MEMLSEEQMNQQLFGTTWNAQRIIPTPQISYMQSMFTESNTVATNGDQAAGSSGKGTYSSERSQLNNQSNHFSSLAIWAIIVCSLIAALLFTGGQPGETPSPAKTCWSFDYYIMIIMVNDYNRNMIKFRSPD